MSVRRVATHVRAMSRRFRESAASGRFSLDQKTLEALVALLSHSLHASITGHHFEQRTFSRADDGEEIVDSGENIRNGSFPTTSCELEGALSARQVVRLVTEVLEMPTDLMLVRERQPNISTPDLPC